MSGHIEAVKETNATMYLTALNAIVNTARLGSSRSALGALSLEVHEISKESETIVGDVLPLLERVTQIAAAMSTGCGSVEDSAMSVTTAERGIELLAGLVDRVLGDAATLRARTDRQREAVRQARGVLPLLTATREQIERLRAELAGLVASLGPAPARASSGAEDQLMASYTMESERDIHRRALRGESAVVAAPQPGNGNSDSGLGDNVELF